MAIYHCNVRPLPANRAAAAIAYITRKATDLGDGTCQPSKEDGHLAGGDALPPHATLKGTEAIWRAAYDAERLKRTRPERGVIAGDLRQDAQIGSTATIALPHEVADDERNRIAAAIAQRVAERYHVAVRWDRHAPGADEDRRNHHLHLAWTTRSIGPKGFGPRNRELTGGNRRSTVREIRAIVEAEINAGLIRAGLDIKVSAATLKRQGLDRPPQRRLTKSKAVATHPDHTNAHAAVKAMRSAEAPDHRRRSKAAIARQASRLAATCTKHAIGTQERTEAWRSLLAVCRDAVRNGYADGDAMAVAKTVLARSEAQSRGAVFAKPTAAALRPPPPPPSPLEQAAESCLVHWRANKDLEALLHWSAVKDLARQAPADWRAAIDAAFDKAGRSPDEAHAMGLWVKHHATTAPKPAALRPAVRPLTERQKERPPPVAHLYNRPPRSREREGRSL